MTDAIEVRLAVEEDADGLAQLFAEDYTFYGLPVPSMDELRKHVRHDVIGSGASVMVAVAGARVVGFAIAAVLFPAPMGTGQM